MNSLLPLLPDAQLPTLRTDSREGCYLVRDDAFVFQGRKPSVFGAYQSYDAAKDQALTVLGAPNLLPVSLLCLWLDPMLFDNGALSRLLTTISSSSARVYFSRMAAGQVNPTLAAMAKAMRGVARKCPEVSEIALVLCDVADGLAETRRSQVIEWPKGSSEFLRTEASRALVLANLNRVTELSLFAATKLSEAGFDLTDDMSAIRIEGYAPLAFVVDDFTVSRGRTPNPARDTSSPPTTEEITNESLSNAKQAPEPGPVDPRAAFDLSRLELRYEPIIDTASGCTVALQALLTDVGGDESKPPHPWANQKWSQVYGYPRVDQHVLDLACTQLGSWKREGFEVTLCVPVNLESMAKTGIAETWLGIIRDAGLSPGDIDLGVTPLSRGTGPVILDNVDMLSNAGVRFTQLGFGVAFSSMSLLKRFPFARLEVAAESVRELPDDANCAQILRSTFQMTNHLGIKACAEAVDTSELANEVGQLGAQEIRGLASSPPLDGDKVRSWVMRDGNKWFQPRPPKVQHAAASALHADPHPFFQSATPPSSIEKQAQPRGLWKSLLSSLRSAARY